MPEHDAVDAHRGWRIVFVVVHVAFVTMNVRALANTVRQRSIVEPMHWGFTPEQFNDIWFIDIWGTLGRLCLLAWGAYLAALIARGDRRVPRAYVWYGVAFLVFEAVLGRALLQSWDVPRGTPHASYASRLAVYAAAMVAWVGAVSLSRIARATFVHDPPVVRPVGRLLIGLGALAFIFWPFALNAFVDATSVLAAQIQSRDITTAEGFAGGIMAASVATGLFVLLKHAWRMRNVWIAVFLPASFAVLVVLYEAQSFELHWTF